MFLLVKKATKQILMSSARPFDISNYEEGTVYLIEIPDDEYTPEMVGGTLDG